MADEPLGEPPVLLRQELARRDIDATQFRAFSIGERIEI
jgi:hypothetical protein